MSVDILPGNVGRAFFRAYGPMEMGGYVLRDDGSGPYLHEWSRPEPRPSAAEIAALCAALDAPPTLADAKADKLLELQALKNAAQDAGFQVGGVRFDSDARARTAYLELALILMENPLYATAWKASDAPETWVTMDAALFGQVRAAAMQHVEACFARRHLRAMQVEAATSLEEVAAVIW